MIRVFAVLRGVAPDTTVQLVSRGEVLEFAHRAKSVPPSGRSIHALALDYVYCVPWVSSAAKDFGQQ
jgi:hypothetical protein